jgi:hypothetical protein
MLESYPTQKAYWHMVKDPFRQHRLFRLQGHIETSPRHPGWLSAALILKTLSEASGTQGNSSCVDARSAVAKLPSQIPSVGATDV